MTPDAAYRQGLLAATDGQPFSACPYGQPQGALARAWRRGYEAGEVEQGDVDGDLFRGVAK